MANGDNLVSELLARGGESRTLEYKATAQFGIDPRFDLKLIRNVIGMGNTAGGGFILIGVDDKQRPTGLNDDQRTSFDTTRIAQQVARYADPPPVLRCVTGTTVEGHSLVAIDIEEFHEGPIVCHRHGDTPEGDRILREAAIYVRTDEANTVEVPDARTMRGLLGRALRARSDILLSEIERLFEGGGPSNEGNRLLFDGEATNDIEFFAEHVGDGGRWSVRIFPTRHDPGLWSRAEAREAVHTASVALRGWDFPHIDDGAESAFEDGLQSHTEAGWERVRYIEAWRAHQSGHFHWERRLWEDLEGHEGVSDFVNVIFACTEFVAFASRLYAPDEVQSLVLRVDLLEVQDRRLGSLDPQYDLLVGQPYVAVVPNVTSERELDLVTLRTKVDHVARAVTREVFEMFGWLDPDENMMAQHQDRLRPR